MSAADFRAVRRWRLVVVPDGDEIGRPATLPAPAARPLADSRAALTVLRDALESPGNGRGAALKDAAAATAALAAACAPQLCDPTALAADLRDPHDVYMGMRRGPLTADQAAAEVVVVLARTVGDLAFVSMDVNDMVAEVDGMLELLRPLTADGHNPPPTPVAVDMASDELERWISSHHFYAVLYRWVAGRLREVVAAVREQRWSDAAGGLDGACVVLRASTGAMVHAASMPQRLYLEVVRPTMIPPRAPFALGGSMNADNAIFRAAVDELLDALPGDHDELRLVDPSLAVARSRFLDLDLLDMERHVTVAAWLVGEDRSLLQRPDSQTNAVGILRAMHQRRARRYAGFIRYDRTTGATAPA